ncbi:hypothetical protein [Dechloromonas hortensis]|uniref:hypothetical protein n=1 Tax=Dechloromonas hortensis TaxID=337779 RepID=UPI001290ECEE|nr:hypothetical protein [Dechloromonas hortensis]
MLTIPSFEHSALVTDDPLLAAQISALFVYPGRYIPVMDGPRMSRPDADNEVVRRRNALALTEARQVLMGGLSSSAVDGIRPGWKNCTVADQYCEHLQALRGSVKSPRGSLRWGPDNLGVGVYRARLARQELLPDLDISPSEGVVEAGTHLLVACERGNLLAEVVASNLAFSCGASYAVFSELAEGEREDWIEEIYALGEGGDLTGRFSDLKHRARAHLGQIDFARYKSVLFVTAGFPWGVAVPEVATTHMYRYPDLGRAVIEGIRASQKPDRSARTALLIDPQTVDGSEIPAINQALLKNGTLTRVVRGPAATQTRVQFLLDLLPHDVIVISSHAGDAPGERVTYEYPDAEGRQRQLVVDRALGIGHDAFDDKFMVVEYHRFHSLDGVDWRDKAGKSALPVGSAITTWSAMEGPIDRKDYITAQQSIPRVNGSMAIKLHDGIWLYAAHGFAPGAAPLFVNNSCWSWHELSIRTTFAGARGYLGSLFPITDVEAQEVGGALFGKYIGVELHRALWLAQRDIYGSSERRPYVLVGLPFIAIRPCNCDAVSFMNQSYLNGIVHWEERKRNSPHEDVRKNARRFSSFLAEDLQEFRRNLRLRHRPPR